MKILKKNEGSIMERPVMPLHINKHHLLSTVKCKPFPSHIITSLKASQGTSIKHDTFFNPNTAPKKKEKSLRRIKNEETQDTSNEDKLSAT